MTKVQLLAGLGLFILFVIRPLAYRSCALKYNSQTSSFFTGIWMMAGVIVSLPFFKDKLYIDGELFIFSMPLWMMLLSMSKGLMISLAVKLQQIVRRESTSSSVFFGPIGVGLGAIANYFLLDVPLTAMQFTSVLGLGILSTVFFLYGHASNITKNAKMAFLLSAAIVVISMLNDQVVISNTNWYIHICLGTLTFFIISLMQSRKLEVKKILLDADTIKAGLAWIVSEFYLLSILVTVLPVSIAGFCIQLTIPVLMLLSAKRWQEDRWQEQLVFGILAFALAMPLVLS